NISTKSEPLIEKKGTPASPETALASNVLPVPGSPTSKTPRGILAPISRYFFGYFKKSTISANSSFSSSTPATSANVVVFFVATLAGDLAKSKACLFAPPPRIVLYKNTPSVISRIIGNNIDKMSQKDTLDFSL